MACRDRRPCLTQARADRRALDQVGREGRQEPVGHLRDDRHSRGAGPIRRRHTARIGLREAEHESRIALEPEGPQTFRRTTRCSSSKRRSATRRPRRLAARSCATGAAAIAPARSCAPSAAASSINCRETAASPQGTTTTDSTCGNTQAEAGSRMSIPVATMRMAAHPWEGGSPVWINVAWRAPAGRADAHVERRAADHQAALRRAARMDRVADLFRPLRLQPLAKRSRRPRRGDLFDPTQHPAVTEYLLRSRATMQRVRLRSS